MGQWEVYLLPYSLLRLRLLRIPPLPLLPSLLHSRRSRLLQRRRIGT